jgi:hypothetical protein
VPFCIRNSPVISLAPAVRWPRPSAAYFSAPGSCAMRRAFRASHDQGNFGVDVERLKLAFMARAAAQKLCHHRRDLTLGITAWITLQHNLLTGVGHGKIGLGSNNHAKVWQLRCNRHFALVAVQLKLCQIIDRITYRLSCAGDTDIDIDDPRLSLGLVLRKSQCVAPE